MNYKNTIFTGIGENSLDNAGFKLFPNPVKDKLHFEFETNFNDKSELTIANALGQIVYSKNRIDLSEEIDVNFLNPGIYFIKLESNKVRRVLRILKE